LTARQAARIEPLEPEPRLYTPAALETAQLASLIRPAKEALRALYQTRDYLLALKDAFFLGKLFNQEPSQLPVKAKNKMAQRVPAISLQESASQALYQIKTAAISKSSCLTFRLSQSESPT
jgi:hypothetical protein